MFSSSPWPNSRVKPSTAWAARRPASMASSAIVGIILGTGFPLTTRFPKPRGKSYWIRYGATICRGGSFPGPGVGLIFGFSISFPIQGPGMDIESQRFADTVVLSAHGRVDDETSEQLK